MHSSCTLAQARWAPAGQGDDFTTAKAVVLSRSDIFADALGGAALAAAKQGPLLLTPPTGLNLDTKTEIQRVLGSSGEIYVLGSPTAISAGVVTQLTGLGYHVDRISGPDRYQTSIAIADTITKTPDQVLVSTGLNFPDALSAGAAAGSYDSPGASAVGFPSSVVILSKDTALPAPTLTYLNGHKAAAEMFGIGNQAWTALQNNGLGDTIQSVKLAGANRYETSAAVAQWFFSGNMVQAGLATGFNWPDALGGGAFMGSIFGPMVLTAPVNNYWKPASSLFSSASGSLTFAYGFGASNVLADSLLTDLGRIMSGPAGFVPPAPSGVSPLAKRANAAGGQSVLTPTRTPLVQPKLNHPSTRAKRFDNH